MNINGYILSIFEVTFLITFAVWLLLLLLCTLPNKIASGWLFDPEKRSFYTVLCGTFMVGLGETGGWNERKEWLIIAAVLAALLVGWSAHGSLRPKPFERPRQPPDHTRVGGVAGG